MIEDISELSFKKKMFNFLYDNNYIFYSSVTGETLFLNSASPIPSYLQNTHQMDLSELTDFFKLSLNSKKWNSLSIPTEIEHQLISFVLSDNNIAHIDMVKNICRNSNIVQYYITKKNKEKIKYLLLNPSNKSDKKWFASDLLEELGRIEKIFTKDEFPSFVKEIIKANKTLFKVSSEQYLLHKWVIDYIHPSMRNEMKEFYPEMENLNVEEDLFIRSDSDSFNIKVNKAKLYSLVHLGGDKLNTNLYQSMFKTFEDICNDEKVKKELGIENISITGNRAASKEFIIFVEPNHEHPIKYAKFKKLLEHFVENYESIPKIGMKMDKSGLKKFMLNFKLQEELTSDIRLATRRPKI